MQGISQGLNPFSSVDSASGVPQPSAFDSFLKIDAIPGESTDQDRKDWIEVLSFSCGMHKPGAADAVSHDRLYILKTIDKSSPYIFSQPLEEISFNTRR